MNEHRLSKENAYWKQKLAYLPRLNLPIDRKYSGARPNDTTQITSFPFSKKLFKDLKELAQQKETTLFIVLLTAFKILLYRYTDQRDIAVGTFVANQTQDGAQCLVLRTSFDEEIYFDDLLKIVKQVYTEAIEYQVVSFEYLKKFISSNESFQKDDSFLQVCFTKYFEKKLNNLKFDLSFDIEEKENGLTIHVEYMTELFDSETIERLIGHYQELTSNIVTSPKQMLEQYQLITEAERNQILSWSRGPKSVVPNLCVHQIFEEQVIKNPLGIAVSIHDEQLTYEQLNKKANQLAHHLCKLSVKPGDIVAVSIEQSLDLIIAVLGVLKANAVYVVLDPTYPAERLLYMLKDTNTPLLITQSHLNERFSTYYGKLLYIESLFLENESASNLDCTRTPDDLLYIVYTSGSTGEPKGIQITHQAVVKLVINTNYIEIKSDDVVGQASNTSFDAATFEIWSTLLNGAHLKIIPRDVLLSPDQLQNLLIDEKVTILFLVTSIFNQLLLIKPDIFKSLKCVLFGGDRVDFIAVSKVVKSAKSIRLINCYGPAETTVMATTYEIQKNSNEAHDIPIGQPIANTDVYILDQHLQLQAIGISGEIFIGGALISKGYLNKEVLTSEAFIKHPFSDDNNQYLYRSGDLGLYRPDGNLEFLGRIDQQAKIRGFRVEIDEVTYLLSKHTKIKQVYITSEFNKLDNRYLIAYVVSNSTVEFSLLSEEFREFLEKKLPEYMIPRFFIVLKKLPLTPNGKVDTQFLETVKMEQLLLSGLEADEEKSRLNNVKLETVIEKTLLKFWIELLGIKNIKPSDNFFKLGGYSLLGMHLIALIRENFNIDISIQDLFQNPTLSKFSKRVEVKLDHLNNNFSEARKAISHIDDKPLSFQQHQLWLISELDPFYTAYNESFTIHFNHSIDVNIFEKSIFNIVQRHEILRTTFEMKDSKPFQNIHCKYIFKLEFIDLKDCAEDKRENQALELARKLTQQPFNLRKLPLFRALLIKISENDYRFYLCIHHILIDGESFLIFAQELEYIYLALQSQKTIPLKPLKIQFSDFSYWQREQFSQKKLLKQKEYWQKKLENLSRLNLPTDRPYPENILLKGDVQHFVFPRELVEGLKQIARQEDTTLFTVLLTVFKILLYRYTGQMDIPVATVISKRDQTEIEPLIGYFMDNLVLRTQFDNTIHFLDLLKIVKKNCIEAYDNQDIPYEQLVQMINPNRSLGQRQNPLVQAAFVLEPEARRFSKSQQGWELKYMAFHSGFVKFDLYMELESHENELLGRIEYSTELFDHTTIQRMIDHYLTLINSILNNPRQSLPKLSILTESEHKQLLSWSIGPKSVVPNLCVHQIFEQEVLKNPLAIAISDEKQKLTYEQLNKKANQLAHYLCKNGIKSADIVVINMERSLQLIVTILAIVKANAIYVCSDPAYPAEKLTYMLKDTSASLLITESYLNELDLDYSGKIICLDKVFLDEEDDSNLVSVRNPDDLLYIVYTSGSTGTPKGIKITHKIISKLTINTNFIKLNSEDIVSQALNPTFDVFTFEIFSTFLNGAHLKIISKEILLSPIRLEKFINNEKLTVLILTTALFHQLAVNFPKLFNSLKYVLFSGEPLDSSCVKKITQPNKPKHLVNLYGPAEASTYTTYYEIETIDKDLLNIPIGRSITNAENYILNSSNELQPIGVEGEICIGGDLVSKGYLNQEDLTKLVFVKNPFSKNKDQYLYKSGDLGRYKSDGNIEFLGRTDHQIKIRGFRVEIGEILSAIQQHSSVKQAYVAYEMDKINNPYLIAYVVSYELDKFSLLPAELRRFLQKKLPDYMIPRFFIVLENFPLTINGKINVEALSKQPTNFILALDYVVPETDVEMGVVSEISTLLDLDKAPLSMTSNFFEIGGNSLLGLQLISNLSKKFFVHLDFSILYQTKTIQEIADKIDPLVKHSSQYAEDFLLQTQNNFSTLIQIQKGDYNYHKPLFFAPAAGGQVLFYKDLIKYLDKKMPIYGFRAQGYGEHEIPHTRIEDMASHYLQILKKVQPNGPYYLIGASSGGLVVYEMAQQLISQQERIALLMLIDAPDPSKVAAFQNESDILRFFFSTALGFAIDEGKLSDLNFDEQVSYILEQGIAAGLLPANYQAEHIRQVLSIFKATYIASAYYKLKSFPGNGWYIKAAESGFLSDFSHEKIWQNHFYDLKLITMPGNHLTMLQEPYVEKLARYLGQALNTVELNLDKV